MLDLNDTCRALTDRANAEVAPSLPSKPVDTYGVYTAGKDCYRSHFYTFILHAICNAMLVVHLAVTVKKSD